MTEHAKGQDRSAWQSVGAWNVQGCTWGIAKATEALDFHDPNFPANWKLMGEQLEHRGAYHFFHPQLDPALQADFFVACVEAQDLGEEAILVIDSELAFSPSGGLMAGDTTTLPRRSHLFTVSAPSGEIAVRDPSNQSLLSISSALPVGDSSLKFLERVHEHRPHNPLWIYTNKNVGSMLDACDGFPFWVAWPSLTPPDMTGMPVSEWDAWQWAWTGGFDNCDQDVWRGTAAEMTEWVRTFKAISKDQYKRWTVHLPFSLNREAAAHHTTPEKMLETARHAGYEYGEPMEEYIEAGDWNRRLPRGVQLFAPAA